MSPSLLSQKHCCPPATQEVWERKRSYYNHVVFEYHIHTKQTRVNKAIAENKPLSLTGDSFPKVIVRHDIRKRWYDDNGVLNIGVIDFLLDPSL